MRGLWDMSRPVSSMLISSRAFVAFLLVAFNSTLFASSSDQTATALLQKMRDALIHQNYEGTFVYMNGKDMETMLVVHEWADGRERSHITALSGPAREVHRDDQYLTCIWPEMRSVRKEPIRSRDDFLLPVPLDPAIIEAYYQYRLDGEERIAGKTCSLVTIEPLDDYRFGHQYCLEAQTGIPLKVTRMDTSGKVIEQMVFTEIAFPASIDQKSFDYQARTEGYEVSHVSLPQEKVEDISFKFNGLPVGFKVKSSMHRPASSSENEFYQLVIGDGLANVSLFISPEKTHQGMMHNMLQSGAVHAMERMKDGYHLTAVGEVPAKTLSVVLDSIVVSDP